MGPPEWGPATGALNPYLRRTRPTGAMKGVAGVAGIVARDRHRA